MLILLYASCGVCLGFIVGYWFGFDTHAMQVHGKKLDLRAWVRRRLLTGL